MNQRVRADHLAEICLIRLWCMASIAVTALTRILPLAVNAAWWVTLLCLLPGLLTMAVLRLTMAFTKTATVTEALRASLGPFGGWAVSLLLGAGFLFSGTEMMTALVTLFTEGIGTRGTQFTLALLTAGVMLFCLHREGLARAATLLRWPMIVSAVTLLAFAVPDMRCDGLYPLTGPGMPSVRAALSAGASLAWPLAVLLTVPKIQGVSRGTSAVSAAMAVPALLLAMALFLPPNLLASSTSLADALFLPVHYLPPAVRTLGQCLLMLVLFLAVAASAMLSTVQLCAPVGRRPAWLPYAVVALLALTQALDTARLWRVLSAAAPWGIVPFAALAAVSAAVSAIRRTRP